uniref:Jumping translocation breakpoint protein n=1 Tax=Panagrellus redivivus TaxID=6233 RepID=A0A7E4ZTR5_PANRE
MLLLIGLLLATCCIMLFEEYLEENEFENARLIDKVINFNKDRKVEKNKNTSSATVKPEEIDCTVPTNLKIVNSCVACSDFEISALKTNHCRETGFYNKYICPANNQSIYAPCRSGAPTTSKFGYFSICSFISSAGFVSFVNWRRSVIDHRAYMRLNSFLG